MVNNKITVWIKKDVVSQFSSLARESYPYETGGVLIGYWDKWKSAVVTQCVGPGPNAVHKLYSFSPDHDYQVKEIERIYTESNRIERYLGDWHVHPDNRAYLSETDIGTLQEIAHFKPAKLKVPLMIVLGTKPTQLKCWSHKFTSVLKRSSISECIVHLFA